MTDAFDTVCAERDVAYLNLRNSGVDWALWWSQATGRDGVHPGAEAYASLAKVFSAWPAWQAWIGQ